MISTSGSARPRASGPRRGGGSTAAEARSRQRPSLGCWVGNGPVPERGSGTQPLGSLSSVVTTQERCRRGHACGPCPAPAGLALVPFRRAARASLRCDPSRRWDPWAVAGDVASPGALRRVVAPRAPGRVRLQGGSLSGPVSTLGWYPTTLRPATAPSQAGQRFGRAQEAVPELAARPLTGRQHPTGARRASSRRTAEGRAPTPGRNAACGAGSCSPVAPYVQNRIVVALP